MNRRIAIPIVGILAVGAIVTGVLYAQETGKVEDAQSEIVSLEGNVSTLETEVAAAAAEVSALQIELADAEATVSTLEAEVADAEAGVSTLETELAAAEVEVSALQIELAVAEARVSVLEAELAAAEAGKEAGIPGSTLADLQLQNDVLAMIMILERTHAPDCTNPEVINSEVTGNMTADGSWGEHWTLDSCGVTAAYDIWFVPGRIGETFFSVIRVEVQPTDMTPVTFPDAGLEAAIREALNKPEGSINRSDLWYVTVLETSEENGGISELTGLEYCVNLERLVLLGGGNISDISVLAGLTNLKVLWLYDNNISDISPLAGLTSLQGLNLGANNISDFSVLAGLTSLKELWLWDNSISDISSLAGLTTLLGLNLGENNISDISVLAGLTDLQWLYLYYNNISDISPLAGLSSLEGLDISYNNISDISPLAGLSSLVALDLSYTNVSDISPLTANSGLSEGDTVDLRNTPLSTTSVDVYIPQLEARGVNVIY